MHLDSTKDQNQLSTSAFSERFDSSAALRTFAETANVLKEDRIGFFSALQKDPANMTDFAKGVALALNSTHEGPCAFADWERDQVLANLYLRRGDVKEASLRILGVFSTMEERGLWEQMLLFCHKLMRVAITQAASGEPAMEKLALTIAEHYATSYKMRQGPVQAGAWSVEQGEYGISNSSPIGTHSVEDCLSLALWHKKSQTVLLSHIDSEVDLNEIAALRQQMPAGKLSARLLGVSGDLANARNKLEKTLEFLKADRIELISADVLRENAPRCWVINPHDFSVAEALPQIQGKHADAVPVFCWLSHPGKPLLKAFDLREKREFNPLKIEFMQIYAFSSEYMNNSIAALFDRLKEYRIDSYSAAYVKHMKELLKEAYTSYAQAIQARLKTMTQQGLAVPGGQRAQICQRAFVSSKFIGNGCHKANQPLIEEFLRSEGLLCKGVDSHIDT